MDAERYQRIKDILLEAGALPGDQRESYLARVCAGDADLMREVRELLAAETVRTGAIFDPNAAIRLGSDAAAPDTPAPSLRRMPEVCGDYRVEQEIGRGGMGIVFAARDPEGNPVAIKVVEGHLALAPPYIDRFLREAEAGRKVDHQNVVRTLDVFEIDHEGRPLHVMVMEFVAGQTLRELLQSMGVVPEGLLREIARQAAAGLAAVHAAGVVHRDIKPENILISDDQIIRIMDLGVAKFQDVSVALTNEGQFIGSLPYAPPEQCRGEPVNEISDLYSLGVVLYELASGSNPFRRDNPAAALQAHLNSVPPLLSESAPDITPFFATVLATLLEKTPGARFGSARQLAEVLDEGETGSWWRQRRRESEPQRRRLRMRRDSAVHGRRGEIDVLAERWAEARNGAGSVVWLSGEPGLGKTRLVDAFLSDYVGDGSVHVLYGSFPPDGGTRGLIDAIVSRFPTPELAHALEPYLGPMKRLAASLHAFLRRESPHADVPALAGESLRGVFRQLVKGLAAERPLIWVVDDFHFASQEARTLVHAMAGAVAGTRALLLVTSRPGCEDHRARIASLDHGSALELQRLDAESVRRILRDVLQNAPLADELTARMVAKSDGVPFFVLETVRALEESGFLERRADGAAVQCKDIDEIEVPSAVRDLIGARLSGLQSEERRLLDVAAVVGFEFDADLVAEVLGRPLIGVLQDLAELERTWGVVRAAGRAYRFDHHQFQEAVYRDLAPRLREELHTLLAAAYRARVGADVQPNAETASLAWHAFHGRRPHEARDALGPAMEYLTSRYANERLIALADRTVELELDDAAQVDVLLQRASALEVLGRRSPQRQAVGRAVELATRLGDSALLMRAHRAYGTYCWNVGHATQALDAFERELELARGHGDELLEITAMVNRAVALGRVGRFQEAVEDYGEVYDRARALGDQKIEAQCVGNWAMALVAMGRFAEALETMESKRVDSGDARSEAHIAACLGLLYWHIGRFDEARENFETQYESALSIGDRRSQGIALGNLGLVYRDLGQLAEALLTLQRQIDLSREIGDLPGEANGHLNIGLVYRLLGDHDELTTRLRRADEVGRVAQHHRVTGHTILVEAEVAAEFGHHRKALDLLAEARAVFSRVGDQSNLAGVDIMNVRVAILQGQLDVAEKFLSRARESAALPGLELYSVRLKVLEAHLESGDSAAAEATLREWLPRIGVCERADLYYMLYRASGDRAHLAEAHRWLMLGHDGAPPPSRQSMLTQPPVHRAIVEEFHAGA